MHDVPAPSLVWLFDVDGTLIVTDGAAREAFGLAVAACFGREMDMSDIAFAGRTDPLILGDILTKLAVDPGPEGREQFWKVVVGTMETMLHPGRGRVLPGVEALLDRIEAEGTWVSTLLTGNMRRMATVKLRRYGLERRFAGGAFGDEAPNRNDLARLAVERVAGRWRLPPGRCIVVGDTEHDIACARAAGARAVAVATGVRGRIDLEPHRPDLLLDDLAEPEALVEWARELAV